jgi:hypothetical protein
MTREVPALEVVQAWVDASCSDAGLPVKVTDATVVVGVAAVLGVAPPRAGGAPSAQPPASQLPDGGEAAGVEAVEASAAGGDDHVVEDGGDDRVLPGQGQRFPEAA